MIIFASFIKILAGNKNSQSDIVDFEQRYKAYKQAVEKHLEKFLLDGEPQNLYEPIRYILGSGGKRIRPVLLLLACESAGGNYRDALDCAVAVEIFHNFTLVHDDIMDNADFRRGLETVHKKWDTNTAILTGDAMFAIAYQFLNRTKSKRLGEIISAFTQSAIEVCEGQALDLKLEASFDVKIDDYFKMIEKKTASLIKNSLKIGGLVADAEGEKIKALENFGLNIGLAFQIQDDLLDVIADENFGKSIGGDIVNGKRTFLLLLAYERVEGKDREIIEKVFRKDGVDFSLVPAVREIYYRYDVIETARQEVENLTHTAIKSLYILPENEAREMLEWFAKKLLDRKI